MQYRRVSLATWSGLQLRITHLEILPDIKFGLPHELSRRRRKMTYRKNEPNLANFFYCGPELLELVQHVTVTNLAWERKDLDRKYRLVLFSQNSERY